MMDLLLKPELRYARAVRLRELFCSLSVCIQTSWDGAMHNV